MSITFNNYNFTNSIYYQNVMNNLPFPGHCNIDCENVEGLSTVLANLENVDLEFG